VRVPKAFADQHGTRGYRAGSEHADTAVPGTRRASDPSESRSTPVGSSSFPRAQLCAAPDARRCVAVSRLLYSLPSRLAPVSARPLDDERMDRVFLLHHVHEFSDGSESVKLIGAYSSRANAEAAIRRLAMQPGFSELPAGFTIDEYHIDQDNWVEGFVTQ
jgi:hypothetical protein